MRSLHVYPKAGITGTEWWFLVKVTDADTRVQSRFEHVEPAGVTATVPLTLLKLCFDMQVEDTDLDSDVDDALYVDDIKPGGGVQTVWGNWRDVAETIVSSLSPGYTRADFWAAWSKQKTDAVKADARRALITQRGWSIPVGSIHQHEGDGTVTEE